MSLQERLRRQGIIIPKLKMPPPVETVRKAIPLDSKHLPIQISNLVKEGKVANITFCYPTKKTPAHYIVDKYSNDPEFNEFEIFYLEKLVE